MKAFRKPTGDNAKRVLLTGPKACKPCWHQTRHTTARHVPHTTHSTHPKSQAGTHLRERAAGGVVAVVGGGAVVPWAGRREGCQALAAAIQQVSTYPTAPIQPQRAVWQTQSRVEGAAAFRWAGTTLCNHRRGVPHPTGHVQHLAPGKGSHHGGLRPVALVAVAQLASKPLTPREELAVCGDGSAVEGAA